MSSETASGHLAASFTGSQLALVKGDRE